MYVDANASALTGDGRMDKKSDNERRSYGWIWVWGALFAFAILEVARLA